MKFRKKPVVIEAVQLCRKNWDDVCALMADAGPALHAWQLAETCSDPCDEPGPYIELPIPTLEGIHLAKHGDWIIKGVKGELYPCKPDIFAATYEAAPDGEGASGDALHHAMLDLCEASGACDAAGDAASAAVKAALAAVEEGR